MIAFTVKLIGSFVGNVTKSAGMLSSFCNGYTAIHSLERARRCLPFFASGFYKML